MSGIPVKCQNDVGLTLTKLMMEIGSYIITNSLLIIYDSSLLTLHPNPKYFLQLVYHLFHLYIHYQIHRILHQMLMTRLSSLNILHRHHNLMIHRNHHHHIDLIKTYHDLVTVRDGIS